MGCGAPPAVAAISTLVEPEGCELDCSERGVPECEQEGGGVEEAQRLAGLGHQAPMGQTKKR